MKTTYIFLAAIAIIMYNGMLAKRDQALFQNQQTLKERYCAQPEHRTQPNCTVE